MTPGLTPIPMGSPANGGLRQRPRTADIYLTLRVFSLSGERENGAWGRIRTTDTRIFSPLLYQLSYPGGKFREGGL